MIEPKLARVVIIACGKSKLPHAAPARDLYTGSLFRAAREHAEATGSAWFIASAKHGLIPPHAVIEPYDQRLGKGAAARFVRDTSIDAWRDRVAKQLAAELKELGDLDGVSFEILAGADYVAPIREAISRALSGGSTAVEVRDPLKGKQVGERLAWLKARREERDRGILEQLDPAFLARATDAATPVEEPDELTEEEYAAAMARLERHPAVRRSRRRAA